MDVVEHIVQDLNRQEVALKDKKTALSKQPAWRRLLASLRIIPRINFKSVKLTGVDIKGEVDF